MVNVASEIISRLRTRRNSEAEKAAVDAAELLAQMERLQENADYQRLVKELTGGYEVVLDRLCTDPGTVTTEERVLAVAKRLIGSGPRQLIEAAQAVIRQAREENTHGG